MKLSELTKELNLKTVVAGSDDTDITGGYASDLMSDVLAKAGSANIWVTNQKHVNAVAVASLLNLAAVVVAGGIEPDENAVEKAQEEGVALLTSELSVFEVAGMLYGLGVRANVDKVSG